MDANELNDNVNDNDAVRPKCDMDAEINIDACPKGDLDAEDFDEDAKKKKQARKKK